MRDSSDPAVAAVINSSNDIVDMLRTAMEPAGIVVVSAFTHEIRDGHVDLGRFLRLHDPKVVVYDIAPPYEPNWNLFRHLCRTTEMRERQIVLTSTNPDRVLELPNAPHQVYEIVGKPFDLEQIVRAVKEATRARPTR